MGPPVFKEAFVAMPISVLTVCLGVDGPGTPCDVRTKDTAKSVRNDI